MQHTVYLFDGFQLDVTRRKLVSGGGLVQSLNSRAMDALLLLVANAGELVEKRRLMQTVWPNTVVEENNLNQCVLAIRKALGEAAGSNRYIMTVPGRGYRFVCPVRELAQESIADTAGTPLLPVAPRAAWWLGITATALGLLSVVLVLVLESRTLRPAAMAELIPANGGTGAMIVLRLDRPLSSHGRAEMDPATVLAECLATQPNMNLQVQVLLLSEAAEPEWAGNYPASVKLPEGLPAVAADPAECREMLTALRLHRVRSQSP